MPGPGNGGSASTVYCRTMRALQPNDTCTATTGSSTTASVPTRTQGRRASEVVSITALTLNAGWRRSPI